MRPLDAPTVRLRLGWVVLLPLLAPGWAAALQVIEARDGVAVEAIVSIKEPTRIRIEGAPIVDVFGNIHSSSCGTGATTSATPMAPSAPLVNHAGEVVVECDRDKGEIYVRPLHASGDGSGGKPVNLFISSAHATYTLLLRRADTPADTIMIRDRTVRASAPDANSPASPSSSPGPAPSHLRRMKALLVAMATDRVPADVRVDELHRPLQLWAESRFVLLRRYEGRGLVGEKYLLRNASAATMVLAEQEFDRPDSFDGGQVLAVAIEHHNLRPGDSTHVYVLRRGGER